VKYNFAYITRILGLSLSLLSLTPAIAQSSTDATIKGLKQQLERPLTSWQRGGFQTTVTGADPQQLSIGTEVWFRFSSQHDCHITMVMIDSEATLTVTRVFGKQALLANEEFRQFPDRETSRAFHIAPPTGLDHFYSFCTSDYLNLSQIQFVDAVAEFRGDDADLAVRQLIHEIASRELRFARSYWTHRVTGRDQQVPYSAQDVVDYFESTETRGGRIDNQQEPSLEKPSPKRLPLEIKFNFDSTELTLSAKRKLDEIGYALQTDTLIDRRYRLGGHTDSTGQEDYNLKLSRKRAESARSYLQTTHKIAPARLEIIAYGELLPKTDNQSVEGRRDNRRVELENLD